MIEAPNVRQIRGEGRRRWFSDDYFDLIVWYQDNGISGFQLCYDRTGTPRVLTWSVKGGAKHNGIDDGDDPLQTYKAIPVLIENNDFDAQAVGIRFHDAAASMPSEISAMVIEQLKKQQSCQQRLAK